jgi:hypothetical protein
MRSTRAAAAWAGIALATSFLSVTIVGTQPHTNATRAIAEGVASLPVNALGSANIVKRTDVINTKGVASAD